MASFSESEEVSAWELRRYLSRQVRRLRFLNKALIIVGCVILLAVTGHVIYYYNQLTALEWNVVTARSQVGSAVQYRANLVPVLIESVASFVQHEGTVFNRTVDARERGLRMPQPVAVPQPGAAPPGQPGGDSIQQVLQRIMAIAKQYPALKTSDVFQLFMEQVTEAEAGIRDARIKYNDAVNDYTTASAMFPGNLYAACFGFQPYRFFEEVRESEWLQVQVPSLRMTGSAASTAGSSEAAHAAGGNVPHGQQ